MPLIYSEGREKALDRLRTSLVSTDAPWIMPFERNPHFTSCESQPAQLEEKLLAKDHMMKIAITGLGGMGKTQLVLKLLYRMKAKHKDCSIIWIPAISVESLHQGYLDVARQLGIPGWEVEKADARKFVQEYLSKDDVGQWLLVFDNADDIVMSQKYSCHELSTSDIVCLSFAMQVPQQRRLRNRSLIVLV